MYSNIENATKIAKSLIGKEIIDRHSNKIRTIKVQAVGLQNRGDNINIVLLFNKDQNIPYFSVNPITKVNGIWGLGPWSCGGTIDLCNAESLEDAINKYNVLHDGNHPGYITDHITIIS